MSRTGSLLLVWLLVGVAVVALAKPELVNGWTESASAVLEQVDPPEPTYEEMTEAGMVAAGIVCPSAPGWVDVTARAQGSHGLDLLCGFDRDAQP